MTCKSTTKIYSPATAFAIILGAAAMLLILFSELFSTPAKTAANAGSSAAVSETAYREQLETQLKELIEQLDGAGKTVVMVTLESGEETIYAVDTQSGQMQNQETHVLLEDGSALEETTYLPAVCGVAVICDGGGLALETASASVISSSVTGMLS